VIVANGGEASTGIGLALLIEKNQWRFYVTAPPYVKGHAGVGITQNISPNWTHLAGTWDGTTNTGSIKLYVNGALAATGTPILAQNNGGLTPNLRIGASAYATSPSAKTWDGLIDEVEIFDRVLTPSDIHYIYSVGAAGKCKTNPGKICGHKFNDLNGNGTWDQLLEPGLQGWTITAIDPSGQSAGTATTDANGKYCIAVPDSTTPYTVTEDIQSQGGNWMQTAPAVPGTHSVSVAVGQTVNNINFGNQKKIILNPKMTVEKTALKAPWQAGNTGTFEISATSPWTITGTPSVPIIIKDIVLNPPFSLSANQPSNAPWVCNDSTNPFISQFVIYYPNSGSNAPPDWFVCTLDTSTNPVNIGDPLPPIHLNVGIDPAYKGGVVHNCAEIGRGSAAMPERYQDQGCVDVPVGTMKNIPTETTAARPPHVSIEKKHSPSRFSTGSKGMFEIKVTNRGKRLTKGMLKVTDHMPVGLAVKSGKFIADLWTCEGGMISSSGQDVTCVFNKTLRKNRWSAIKLNTSIAPKSQFPAAVNVIKNCATVSVQDAAGVMAAGSKVCDTVRIKHVKSSGASSIPIVPSLATPPRFSTGSKGSFSIKVKNKGKKLAKGMLRVVDHMPGGLSVKTGAFRAGSWSCKGGMVTSSGQNVTCAYNRTLGKHSRATLHLNARVAPKGRFPAGVNEVENCATASVQGAAGVLATGPKVCDKIKIRHMKSIDVLNLPIGIGIGGGGGATAPVRKTPGAVR